MAGMAFNVVLVPLLKVGYELAYFIKRENPDIGFSRVEEWRKKLIWPCMDMFLTWSPLLGALLFPEGYQASEDTGRYVHVL